MSPMADLQLPCRAKPGEHGDRDGKPGKALAERLVVLLHEDGGGSQERHLLSAHHCLERGPQGDLGLPVPDVPADQAVHGAGGLHVLLHFLDAAQLVLGLLVGKRRLELALPVGVRGEREARLRLAARVQLQESLRKLLHGLAGLFLALLPAFPAKTVQPGLSALLPDVALDEVDLLDGEEELLPSAYSRVM